MDHRRQLVQNTIPLLRLSMTSKQQLDDETKTKTVQAKQKGYNWLTQNHIQN